MIKLVKKEIAIELSMRYVIFILWLSKESYSFLGVRSLNLKLIGFNLKVVAFGFLDVEFQLSLATEETTAFTNIFSTSFWMRLD